MISKIVLWIAFGLSLSALIIGILALTLKRKVIQKEIVFEDQAVKLENGIIYARGFSNEPYKTNRQATVIKDEQIQSFEFSDGMSKMSEGNLNIANRITCQRFSDGALNIEKGSITTTGTVVADHIIATRTMDVPAEYYANIYILEMQDVNFTKIQNWQEIATNTKSTQYFFPGFNKSHHGVMIGKKNQLQLHKTGKWKYQFTIHVASQGKCHIAASFDKECPQLSNGCAQGIDNLYVHGFGILDVTDIELNYKLYFQHLKEPSSGEYGLQLKDGHLLLEYIGR
jgi:hypothetical protein